MANYSLVVNSKFQPFFFERYIQPYQMYGEAYKEVENALGELATKANVWEEMANEQADPYAYKMYKTYANDLEEKAGQLAREGLNAASRRDMLNMRARYSKEITPIEQAYTARQKQAEQQQQALLQDPTLMLSRRASTTSLDDYIRNPQLSYDAYSGKMLTAQVASAAGALAKEMQNNPRKWRSILGDSYYETMMQKGFSSQAVLQAIQDNPNAAPQLTNIVENVINSSKIRNWGDQDIIDRAYDYARQGLWSAVGETQYQILQNQNLGKGETPTKGLALNPSNIYSSRELNEAEKTYNDNIRKFSDYFYTDAQGRTRLSEKGMAEYRRNDAPKVTSTGSGSGTARLMNVETQMQNDNRFVPTEFRKFMDSIGMNPKQADIDNWNDIAIGNLWQKYVNEDPAAKTAKYDATKASEIIYDLPQTDEYQKGFKAKVQRAIGSDEVLYEVDLDNGEWKKTGNKLTLAEFLKPDFHIISRAPGDFGETWFIAGKDEKAKRYSAIPGIHVTAEDGRDQANAEMRLTQRKLLDSSLTQQQKAKLEEHYRKLKQQVIMFESQLDFTNQTSTQNINPYYIP